MGTLSSNLTLTEMLAAASDILVNGDFSPIAAEIVQDWPSESRLFEDPYSIVAVSAFESWGELEERWPEAQASLVQLMSKFLSRGEPKSWEGYLVLITPGIAGDSAFLTVSESRRDTTRIRKLVATGDELETISDVARVLLPVLPLEYGLDSYEPVSALDVLPAYLADRGIYEGLTDDLLDAFGKRDPLMEVLYRSVQQ